MSIFRDDLKDVQPYRPVEIEGAIRLDRNENPHDLPPELKEEIFSVLSKINLNHYPDAWCLDLKTAFASYVGGISPDEVSIGNGCDEVIQNIVMAFALGKGPVLSFWPTFPTYKIASRNLGIEYIEIPLNNDFSLPLSKTIDAIKRDKPAVIFVCNPNNPSGNCFLQEDIEEIIKASEGIVVIDEVYYEFSNETFLNKFRAYPNVLMLRSLSKAFASAGLMVGFAFGKQDLIEEVEKVRLPYLLSSFSQVTGTIVLKRHDLLAPFIGSIKVELKRIADGLKGMSVQVYDTRANFLLADFKRPAKVFVDKLKEKRIVVRYFPYLPNCIRISAGLKSDTDTLLEELGALLNE